MRARAAMLAACVLAAGCGGAQEHAASTRTATPAASPTNGPEAQPGGAGDEQPLRQPVRLTIDGDGFHPALVKAHALLAVELVIRNGTPREQVVTVVGAKPKRAVSIATEQTGRLRLRGLQRGRYRIEGFAAGQATLVSSLDEP
jgi:hypothetical protein